MNTAKLFLASAFLLLGSVARAEASSFVPQGVYPTTPASDLPRGLPTMGSWIGGDSFEGAYASPWFPARPVTAIFVAGYPRQPGMSLSAQWRDGSGRVTTVPYDGPDARESWIPWLISLPPNAVDIRWIGVDHSNVAFGWLAASDPCDGRWSMRYCSDRIQNIAGYAALGVALLLLLSGILGWAERWAAALIPSESTLNGLSALMGASALALAGYGLFWIWFFSKTAGNFASWGLLMGGGGWGAWKLARKGKPGAGLQPWLMAAIIGSVYAAMLFAFPSHTWGGSAAHRFSASMPGDNDLPGGLAGRLISGESPRGFAGDWLSSDRPPLQSGWILIFWPLMRTLGFNLSTAAGAAGMWLQLLWVPALWALAESTGLGNRKSAAVAFGAAPLGFLLFNTVYVWPKLAAAGFALGGAAIVLRGISSPSERSLRLRRQIAAGLMLGLGLLCHGGAAFAVLALMIVMLCWPGQRRNALAVAATVLLLMLPWVAYQHFYDPPGNRLLKWFLAGVVPIDHRGFWEALADQYRNFGWRYALGARHDNLAMQGSGEWLAMPEFSSSQGRRALETTYYLRSCGWLLPAGIFAWVWLALRRGWDAKLRSQIIGRWALWILSAWLVWLALMFSPGFARAHQGTYVIPLVLYGLLLVSLFAVWPRVAWAIVAVQAVYFFATWWPAAPGYLHSIYSP